MTADPAPQTPRWFDLPTGARDWVAVSGRYAMYLPSTLRAHEQVHGRERLAEWDALAGRILRASVEDSDNDCELQDLAVGVATVAGQLAAALNGE
jgi:hypothetical protein